MAPGKGRMISWQRCFGQSFFALVLPYLCGLPANLQSAFGDVPTSEPQVAVKEQFDRFCAAVREGSYEALLPTLTLRDRLAIRGRLDLNLPVFRVDELQRFFVSASERPRLPAARGDQEVQAAISVTLLDGGRARADVAPLLSFRPSIYLARESGRWKVDLTQTLLGLRHARPKEEIISICRQALHGIADDADLLESEHFLIFAHTGPIPAQTAAQLLEELYRDFQRIFPFDLGSSPPPESAGSDTSSSGLSGVRAPGDGRARSSGPDSPVPLIRGPDPYMVVFLFSYGKTYRQFVARHDPGARSSRGYATPTGYFVTWFHPGFKSVVRHEGAHLLMYRRMRLFGAPSWLAEGTAETMADPRDVKIREMKLRRMLLGGEQLSLGPLMLKEKIASGIDYRVAHSLVHFLRNRHQKEWIDLIRFIRGLPRPQPKECREELLRLLGVNQEQLDEEWRGFVLESKPTGDETPAQNR